mgnify:CR=1 FL=1
MLIVRCKECGKEVISQGSRPVSCGCPNMVVVRGDSVTANDLSKVVMVNNPSEPETKKLSAADIEWQESRRKRKIRKLDFEIR